MAELRESALRIPCGGDHLPAILSLPAAEAPRRDTALLIIVGGPQYRVGSHRQFVQLARAVARGGYAVLRFDTRGMGDADGAARSFEDMADDLGAAIDAVLAACTFVRRVALWGLCDAASVALMHGTLDPRVAGIAIANPWVRNPASHAAATVKHYYRRRILDRELWQRIFSGRFEWKAAVTSLHANLRQAFARPPRTDDLAALPAFQTRMARGLAAFPGPVLLLLSGNDLTAREFVEYTTTAPAWKGLLASPRIERAELHDADHTFSTRAWKAQVEARTLAWLDRAISARFASSSPS